MILLMSLLLLIIISLCRHIYTYVRRRELNGKLKIDHVLLIMIFFFSNELSLFLLI